MSHHNPCIREVSNDGSTYADCVICTVGKSTDLVSHHNPCIRKVSDDGSTYADCVIGTVGEIY